MLEYLQENIKFPLSVIYFYSYVFFLFDFILFTNCCVMRRHTRLMQDFSSFTNDKSRQNLVSEHCMIYFYDIYNISLVALQ